MNSSLQKALVASLLAVGGSVSALGQTMGQLPFAPMTAGGYDWDSHCYDPNATTAPYSAPFISYRVGNALFTAGLGVVGTFNMYKFCNPVANSNLSVPVAGRIGFANGPFGSVQDDFRMAMGDFFVDPDNGATFNYDMNEGTDPADVINPFTGTLGDISGINEEGFSFDQAVLNFDVNLYTKVPTVSGLTPSGSGWSFADVVTGPAGVGTDGDPGYPGTQTAVGSGTLAYKGYEGFSNRYCTAGFAQGGVTVLLYIDQIGDAARLYWQLTNTGTATANIGLNFGQWVYIVGGYAGLGSLPPLNYANQVDFYDPGLDGAVLPMGWGPPGAGTPTNDGQAYAFIPGQQPMINEERFIRSQNPATYPAYITFTGAPIGADASGLPNPLPPSAQDGPGFQIVNSPIADVSNANGQSDLTPNDEVVLGDGFFLLSGYGAVSNPKIGDVLFPDIQPGDGLAYAQKWYPTPVAPGASRVIITYYRSIWGDSDYSNGYSVVVDTPKSFNVSQKPDPITGVPNQNFDYPPNAIDTNSGQNIPYLPIQVDVDNVGNFGIDTTPIAMTNVAVTITLPQGLTSADNPGQQTITNTINVIEPYTIGFTDFKVTADKHIHGVVQYTVTVAPNPGVTKTLYGYINMGATANVLINQGANLITVPYNLSAGDWSSALNLTQEDQVGQGGAGGFLAFNWDAQAQQYVPSTGSVRGIGTWIIANATQGYVPIGSTTDVPTTPTDEFPPSATGAPPITIQPGWNLIANPYNYAIPLGQIEGVVNGAIPSPFDTLVSNGVIDSSFTYYDQGSQQYQTISADTDRLEPNFGYWMYANEGFTLYFMPVYELYVRDADARPAFKQRFNNWKLQMGATQGKMADTTNFLGYTSQTAKVSALLAHKAPASPAKNALSAYLTAPTGSNKTRSAQYTTLMHTSAGRQSYNLNVFTAAAGATTVVWPNLAQIPSNLQVMITDSQTRRTFDARKLSGYSYYAEGQSVRTFNVNVTPEGTERETIGSVNMNVKRVANTKQMYISFDASTRGSANVTVYQGSKQVGTIVMNMDVAAGANKLTWPGLQLLNGHSATSGNYTLSIEATGEGGDTTTKLVNFSL